MLKYSGFFSLFLFFIVSLLSCERPPDYSEVPFIRFEQIRKFYVSPGVGLAGKDSIVFYVYFEDGDGDLGIDQTAAQAEKYAVEEYGNVRYIPADTVIYLPDTITVGDKIQIIPGDTVITPADTVYDHVNFYINEFKKVNGEFVSIDIDGSKGGRFDPLYDTSKKGIIDGVIEHSAVWNYGFLDQTGLVDIGDTIRFEIYVLDRALNKSNTIVTDEIIILNSQSN